MEPVKCLNVMYVTTRCPECVHSDTQLLREYILFMITSTTNTTSEYKHHINHIYATTRNHKYLLVYKGVNVYMFTKQVTY